jgi:spore coat polysaccharide biosynthesis protein SpsF
MGNYDYTSNMVERTYPRGMDTEVIEFKALEKCWRSTSDKDDHEHVTLYIRRHPDLFRIQSVRKEGEPMDELRLCMDTEADNKLITEIYKNLYQNRPIKLTEVTEFLNVNPGLRKLNSDIKQKEVKGKVF